MQKRVLRWFFVGCALIAVGSALPSASRAQSAEPKNGDQHPAAADTGKDATIRRADEIAEVGRLLTGPAANPECVWLGRRVVSLLWRDDLDTAFRHLDLYDRFGCPGGHIQSTFRCVIRLGGIDPKIDPKAPDTLNARVQSCWINPENPPPVSAAAPAEPSAPQAR